MPEGKLAYVICYDIAADKRRHRLAQLLESYGRRVQYSVFEAVLDRPLFDKLLAEMGPILVAGADRVAIYPLCACCARRRFGLGQATTSWPGQEIVYIV
jgi:CRISPR-associated protein Cas2